MFSISRSRSRPPFTVGCLTGNFQPRPAVHGYLPDDSFWPICDCR